MVFLGKILKKYGCQSHWKIFSIWEFIQICYYCIIFISYYQIILFC